MLVQPYLYFDGRCEEALNFYQQALGAKIEMLMRFKESPDPSSIPPGSAEKVMHASLLIGESRIMASDGRCQGEPAFHGISLSLIVPDISMAERVFAALGQGGQVQMPLTETFFSPRFGMVADQFGVSWMILARQQ